VHFISCIYISKYRYKIVATSIFIYAAKGAGRGELPGMQLATAFLAAKKFLVGAKLGSISAVHVPSSVALCSPRITYRQGTGITIKTTSRLTTSLS
jgi:hypothetical protein